MVAKTARLSALVVLACLTIAEAGPSRLEERQILIPGGTFDFIVVGCGTGGESCDVALL